MHKYKNYNKMTHSLRALLLAAAFILTVYALTDTAAETKKLAMAMETTY